MSRVCRFCGEEYGGWRCPCRKRGKRGGRPRSVVSMGCGTRGWRLVQAKARMLGGWDDFGAGPWDGAVNMAEASHCKRCGTRLEEGRCPACFERDAHGG